MKLTPIQKRAERGNRNKTMVDMNLVSLIDVFTILIFFLLSNTGAVETLASTRAVASVVDAMAIDGDMIEPLKAELDLQLGRQVIRKENEAESKRVTIMGDK